MRLLVFPGAGSPDDGRYAKVYNLLKQAGPEFGYEEVDISLRWPGQVNRNGGHFRDWLGRRRYLTLDQALSVAARKVASWEQEEKDYHILCRSFGTIVGLKLVIDMPWTCLKKLILWGVPPYWVAWKYGVQNLKQFKQQTLDKGVLLDDTFFESLVPPEALLEQAEVQTVVASGEKDEYCPPAYLTYLRDMFGSKTNLKFPAPVKGAPHEVVQDELPESVVESYLEVLFG